MITTFWDMHSGGGTKESPYEMILIEAPQAEAEIIFFNRFGHNPYRVSCTCCGEDYSVSESETLEEATGFHRGCRFATFDKNGKELTHEQQYTKKKIGTKTLKVLKTGLTGRYVDEPDPKGYRKYMPLKQYLKQKDVLFIPASEITAEERKGELRTQGYVWSD